MRTENQNEKHPFHCRLLCNCGAGFAEVMVDEDRSRALRCHRASDEGLEMPSPSRSGLRVPSAPEARQEAAKAAKKAKPVKRAAKQKAKKKRV